jgi:two-component system CheB/CheR fusion protein
MKRLKTESKSETFPIVGIGASAGGFEAFQQLLTNLPENTGMAFVLVQHLDPRHKSALAELFSKTTRMPVREAKEAMLVEPNRVYIIPPGKAMTVSSGKLKLSPRALSYSRVIDHFLNSLAVERGSQAIGVILSGTASDGTQGLESIKAEGGLTFAQDERSAKYPGMPKSAIAAGAVDIVLSPERIAQELGRIARHPYILSKPEDVVPARAQGKEEALSRIFERVRHSSGVDFAYYKRSTIMRRIARRMALNRLASLEDYLAYIEKHPAEAQNLGQDLLIRVTSFFRDPSSFEFLKRKLLPKLIKEKEPNTPLRVWVPGCATGEEAYSIAMCAIDMIGGKFTQAPLQLFATDVNDAAIQIARQGLYPEFALDSVPRKYVERFFVKTERGYQVSKLVRDACVFAKQNVTKDPPFSKLDLISCRNLLIYLEPPLQKIVLSVFHYALKPNGCLFLGSSETIGPLAGLYAAGDKKQKVYFKKAGVVSQPPNLEMNPLSIDEAAAVPAKAPVPGTRDIELFRQADRLLLTKFSPAAVLVDENLEILQFRGDTSRYLTPASGRASLNLLKMAREGLLFELRAAVQNAQKEGVPVRRAGVSFERDGGARLVTLEVIPVKPQGESGGSFYLVLFEREADIETAAAPPPKGRDREVQRLHQELNSTREHLQSIIEQQEASNEELQSANEEILSANEELQSTNEEVESAKEELQSVNEELQQRNRELGEVNDDLNNLISGVSMPVVIVSSDLRIRRFTQFAGKVLNLIPGDVGRPITDIKLSIPVPKLKEMIDQVTETGSPQEIESHDSAGRWQQVRVRPYKTKDNKIDGVVVIFVDIDPLRRLIDQLTYARDYAEAIFEGLRVPKAVLDDKLRIRRANRSFCALFRISASEAQGRPLSVLGDGQLNDPRLRGMLEKVVKDNAVFQGHEVEVNFPDAGKRTLLVDARPIRMSGSEPTGLLVALEDITERLQAQEAKELRARVGMQKDLIANVSHELRTPIAAIKSSAETLLKESKNVENPEKFISIIHRHSERLSRLVEELLRLSALETGRRKASPEKIQLPAFVAEFTRGLQPIAEGQKVKLEQWVDPGMQVWFDKAHLQAILENLCENAIRYNKRNGRVKITGKIEGTDGVLTIRDNGIGISPKDLPHVFERFYRSERTRRTDGLGLGLSIAKGLAEANRSHISITSTKGAGTTVTLTLPLPKRR